MTHKLGLAGDTLIGNDVLKVSNHGLPLKNRICQDFEIMSSGDLSVQVSDKISTIAVVFSFNLITASFSIEFSFLIVAAILDSTQLTLLLEVRDN